MGIKTVANANAQKSGDLLSRVTHILTLSFSLIGEELFTAAFAFPIYVWLKDKVSHSSAWLTALLLSSLLFGMLHVNIYHWNLYQCLISIGLGRIPFTWAWRRLDTLRAGIWAHIIYDLVILIPSLFF